MKKIDYVIGVFLAETDIITHGIPETIITKKQKSAPKRKKIKSQKNNLHRKTEHTTKKKNKNERYE